MCISNSFKHLSGSRSRCYRTPFVFISKAQNLWEEKCCFHVVVWYLGAILFCFVFFLSEYQTSTIKLLLSNNFLTIISENPAMLGKMAQNRMFAYRAERRRSHFEEPVTYSSYTVDSTLRYQSHWNPFVGRSHPWSLGFLSQLLVLIHSGMRFYYSASLSCNHREHSGSLFAGHHRIQNCSFCLNDR